MPMPTARRTAEFVKKLWRPEAEKTEELLKKLRHKNWKVKFDAALKLGRKGYFEATPVLLEALAKETLQDKLLATHALGEVKNLDTIPHLVKALDDKDHGVRETAVEALRKIGSAIPEDAFEDKNAWALALIAYHFKASEHPKVVKKAFQEALEEKITEENVGKRLEELRKEIEAIKKLRFA